MTPPLWGRAQPPLMPTEVFRCDVTSPAELTLGSTTDARDPWLLVVNQTVVDPSRAPGGAGTFKILTVAPGKHWATDAMSWKCAQVSSTGVGTVKRWVRSKAQAPAAARTARLVSTPARCRR